MSIAFIDLQAQRARIADRIDKAVLEVVHDGRYVMGPWVSQFEQELATFSSAKHALGCANGTDALVLPLMAWGVGPGDAVFCPSFTFCATAEIIPWEGATPVFVDIKPDTYNMDPDSLEAAITMVKAEGKLVPKVIIGVCLFGQAADYRALRAIADKHGMKLIADSAQGFGTTIDGRHPTDWADAVTTSFFPAKPLGCYGDGGAVLTNDTALANLIDSYRVHGKATPEDLATHKFEHDPRYLNMRVGINSRLDSIQAAILIQKLAIFADEIEARNRVAARYNAALAGHVKQIPHVPDGFVSTWAQYTIEHDNRAGLIEHLKSQGIPAMVYYPVPMHRQGPYAHYPMAPGGLPVSDAKAASVLSLPMHPYLDEATQDAVIAAVIGYSA
ncbi:MAG: DegT/DnrJ/EryC1/StrS aminotransferase family protein [Hyphomonadaceae bacterium]|jgi:dTDP-4-amino-4,6-dideoxygalactose transaminase|nr:DegT/DnrJ/EryC1/StrS aminotransferase family protein [Hyphomonadaceae bacterium]